MPRLSGKTPESLLVSFGDQHNIDTHLRREPQQGTAFIGMIKQVQTERRAKKEEHCSLGRWLEGHLTVQESGAKQTLPL